MIRNSLIAVIVLLLVSQAGPALAQELDPPEEGKAKVYVFYFAGTSLARVDAGIFVDDRYVGNVGSSYYMGFDVEPGEHLVWSHLGGKRSFARLDAGEGKTYYIQLEMVAAAFNPVPVPRLWNACPNDKKGSKHYQRISKRLSKQKFTLADNPPERLEKGQKGKAKTIKDTLASWESEWQKSKKWAVIEPEDGD